MESGEGFRLVLCFQGLWGVLCHVFNGTWGRVNDGGSMLNRGWCLCRSSGGSFGFLAATTHFTWIVRCTTIFGQGAGGRCFNHRSGDFGNHWRFNHGCRFGYHDRSGFNHFGHRCWRFFYHRGRRWCFNRSGRFGSPLEGGLFFTNFAHFWSRFDNRCFNHRFYHWLRLNHWGWLNRSHFNCWQGFLNRCNFHFGNNRRFDRGDGFHDWRFNYRRFYHWGLGDWRFNGSGFFDGGSGAFSLLVSLGFSRCADDRAGNGSRNGQAGSQFGAGRFAGSGFCVLAGFF